MTRRIPERLASQRGFALVATTLLVLLMLTIASAMMMYTVFELQTSGHYNTGNQSMYAAEAGILRAINAINKTTVTNLNTDIVQKWSSVFTPATQSVPAYAQFQYTVSAQADDKNPTTRAWLTSVGSGPNGARRIVRVGIRKAGGSGGIGAIYLANGSVKPKFSGNAFDIDGRDHTSSGSLIDGGPVTPGVSTRSDDVVKDLAEALSKNQKDNIVGQGFQTDPLTASLVNTGGPDLAGLDSLIKTLMADPRAKVLSDASVEGNQTLGTLSKPQLTVVNEDRLRISGDVSGAGILVVDGSLRISGNLNFIGWVIARGGEDGTKVSGNANITGALWTGDKDFEMSGSGDLLYCSACMNLLGNYAGAGGGAGPVTIIAWQEIL